MMITDQKSSVFSGCGSLPSSGTVNPTNCPGKFLNIRPHC